MYEYAVPSRITIIYDDDSIERGTIVKCTRLCMVVKLDTQERITINKSDGGDDWIAAKNKIIYEIKKE